MKRVLLLIVFLFFLSYKCFAGGDFGNWYAVTPFNHNINEEYNAVFFSNDKSGSELKNLERWYFYNSCIIGSYFAGIKNDHAAGEGKRGYFVIDERHDKINVFKDEALWLKYRTDKDLNPLLITRWFNDDWEFFNDERLGSSGFFTIMGIGFISVVSVLYFVTVAVFMAFKKFFQKREIAGYSFLVRKPLMVLCIIGILVLIRFILDKFPVSF